MRILHVNKFFDLNGGAEVYMHQLMKAQLDAGHDVHAFSTRGIKNLPSIDEKYFVTRYHLDRWDGPVTDAKKALNFLWNREAQKSFGLMLDELKPEVVHIHNLYHHLSTSVLAEIRKRGIPTVQTLHDYKLACPNYSMFTEGAPCERCKGGKYFNVVKHKCLFTGFVPNMLAALEMYGTKASQIYEKSVAVFLCPSRFMKEKMEDWGEPPGKLRYLPNPIDLADEPVIRGGGYLLSVGRLHQIKGLKPFIQAAIKVPELPVKIAGRGPQEAELRKLVAESGATHIEFLGFVAPEEVRKLRARAEALVLPSISYENASLTLLEGMASGLPCLATRIGGNPELVEDGVNGFLVNPNDTDDWLRVLRRFLATTPEVRDQMGQKGREKVEKRHLWKDHLHQLDAIYKEVGV